MYGRLKDLFDNTNEWLKFAETKHAALIALNSGVVFGVLSIYKDYKDYIPKDNVPAMLIALVFIVASLAASFISLFPRAIHNVKRKKRPRNVNLYFGGALALYDKEELKKELLKQAGKKYEFDHLEEDLIQQMIVNSTIATKKYKLFKVALMFLITGLVVFFAVAFYLLLL